MSETPSHRTPIIALTACTSAPERQQCFASGMDDFIAKPVRLHDLKAVLTRWLDTDELAPADCTESPSDELQAVHEMFGEDFSELAMLYRNDSPPRIVAIRDAYARDDRVQLAKVAHAFSGSSASIGATGLSAMCRDLELQAKADAVVNFDRCMHAIETEYRRVAEKLQSMLD